jgi:hypothetical protein
MTSRSRASLSAVTLVILLVACTSGTPAIETGPPAGDGGNAVVTEPPAEPATPEPLQPPSAAPEPPPQDPGDVDWATVDLTTIDWATIDLSQVDWAAAGDNPTARDLTAEVQQVIQSRIDPGSATLTIGDETWEFDNFVCAFGHENTESDTFSFTTNSFGEFDGVRTQMQVTIADDSSQGRFEGEGTSQRIDFNDISDFENPSLDWSMSRDAGAIRIDGNSVTAEGAFNDGLTEGVADEIPGTLVATCGDMSRR